MSGVKPMLKLLLVRIRRSDSEVSAKMPVEPKSGAYSERTAAGVITQGEQEVDRMKQMWPLPQQGPACPQAFSDPSDLTLLPIPQPALDDAGGSAGCGAGGSTVLHH